MVSSFHLVEAHEFYYNHKNLETNHLNSLIQDHFSIVHDFLQCHQMMSQGQFYAKFYFGGWWKINWGNFCLSVSFNLEFLEKRCIFLFNINYLYKHFKQIINELDLLCLVWLSFPHISNKMNLYIAPSTTICLSVIKYRISVCVETLIMISDLNYRTIYVSNMNQ